MPVEEHLSSDGVREPEGRSDREDIEIVGRVTDIDATKYDDLLLLLGVINDKFFRSHNGTTSNPVYCDVHVRRCPLELIGVDYFTGR